MMIDWMQFTPWSSLSGGVLLGVASALFILLDGRILGISGIVGGLLLPRTGEIGWRIAFLLGLSTAPLTFPLLAPAGLAQVPRIEAGYGVLIVAGLLVGFGTRCGSGCTSGHGVCGLARLSFRSLVATMIFMVLGFLTVFVVRHLI